MLVLFLHKAQVIVILNELCLQTFSFNLLIIVELDMHKFPDFFSASYRK